MKKALRRSLIVVLGLFIALVTWLSLYVFPAITGYGARMLCSGVYLQSRNVEGVIGEDLARFPFTMGSFVLNNADSSATGRVFGLAGRKAIYRKDCGCTLVNSISEEEIRKQKIDIPNLAVNTDTLSWPYGDKTDTSFPQNVNKSKLDAAVDRVMNETDAEGRSLYTRAVLVLYDGKIIAEKYAPGFDKNTVMLGWSMTKSLTSAMIGILVKQNKLDVDMPAPVDGWAGTEKENILLKHLLQQTSGLDFLERYDRPSDATRMLFSTGDMAAYTAGLPLAHKPGTVFSYSSGNSNILSHIIRKTVGEKDYHTFPHLELFHKINAYSFIIEPDAAGNFIGSSYGYATARDYARFGLLYYYNGVWNGEQILPENWVKETIQPATADPQKRYGYQFWLNGLSANDSTRRIYPDAPADMFYADGFGGQNIFIIPSRKLIVIRLGVNQNDDRMMLKEVLDSVL